MFCSQCGANKADNAVVWMEFGRNLHFRAARSLLPVAGVVIPSAFRNSRAGTAATGSPAV